MADATAGRRVSNDELADSLIFYRRSLAANLAIALVRRTRTQIDVAKTTRVDLDVVAAIAEDLANAVTVRLAARETGDPAGYK